MSVDDFGTGHSSLAYLRQFPLHSLKVDRSFVRGIEGNRDMASIVSAVTTMAQQLGLRVVAEGIEKEEQLGLLRALGCEFGQGYLFSRPIDAEAAAALLQRRACRLAKDGPLDAAAVAMLASLAPAPHLATRDRRTAAVRWLYVAAALAIVWLSAGMPRPFGRRLAERREPGAGAGHCSRRRAVVGRRPGRRLSRSRDRCAGAPRGDAAARAVRRAQPRPRRAAPARAASAAGACRTRAAEAAATPLSLTSLRVVHQHRFGSCRGQLVVSRDGVAYIPEGEGQDKDGFRLSTRSSSTR